MATEALKKILYAEDEPDISEIATMALETIGEFTVESCASGNEALEAAPRFQPDLILLDVMMPGIDGPSTLKALRRLPGFETTPVVFMTAKVMEDEMERFKKLGALVVITKPFDPAVLSDQILAIWEKHHE